MVFYRKYRPQTIDELDSKDVRDALVAILSKDIPHAFLFTGPKGLGKTSTARIVAKVINCLAKRDPASQDESKGEKVKGKEEKKDSSTSFLEPCNTCEACTTITNGTNMDILEIDAASNRGIDEIRELKDKIRLAPLSVAKKVYIIDEVHMLTTEAFNALLKTLEEPPSHAVFILCTTESHKVPATILSRSFHIGFRLATQEELIRSFKRIVAGEGLEVDEDALVEIAALSESGFRDGAKIFEELVAFAQGKKITADFVKKTFHVTGLSSHIENLLQACIKRDSALGLQTTAALVSQGLEVKYFLQILVEILHAEFLRRNGIESNSPYSVDLSGISLFELKQLLRMFMQVQTEMRNTIISQLPLELAIVEWGNNNLDSIIQSSEFKKDDRKETIVDTSKKQNDTNIEVKTETVTVSTNGVSVSNLRKQVGNIAKIKALYGDTNETNASKEAKVEFKTTDLNLMQVPNDMITTEWLTELWRCIIAEMKQHNHTLAGILRGCMLKDFDNKQLVIETSFKFHKEKLDDAKTRTILENICKALTGNPVRVLIELKTN